MNNRKTPKTKSLRKRQTLTGKGQKTWTDIKYENVQHLKWYVNLLQRQVKNPIFFLH